MRFPTIFSYLLLTLVPQAVQAGGEEVRCPIVRIEAERLSDLNIPRSGHKTLCVNGEPTVIGGHTTSFVPTPTAEYYKDGKWHMVQLAYCHDNGCAIELSTSKVLIAGGHEKELGVGQTYMAELYDPVTHTSQGFASLDTKRALPTALALDSGRAVIAGNWHHTDAIEMFDGKNHFIRVNGVTMGRNTPFILRTGKNNAIIVGSRDTVGKMLTEPVADRLYGAPRHIPLLEQWRFVSGESSSQAAFIGDMSTDDYSYLLLLENDQGKLAIARTSGEEFALLATDVPIPTTCQWGDIKYYFPIIADRQHQRAYLLGMDANAFGSAQASTRAYVVTIDYSAIPAHLTLGYTDVMTDIDICNCILTDDGNLMLTGGTPTSSNFHPTAATWLLHVNPQELSASTGFSMWGWGAALLATGLLAVPMLYFHRKRSRHKEAKASPTGKEECPELSCGKEADLINRICQVVEDKKLYLNPDLKVSDIATELNTNQRAVSDSINAHRGTFRQFINAYRVSHAQEMLRSQSDVTITEVWLSSGFSSESSFFRIFKATTGSTPLNWKQNAY